MSKAHLRRAAAAAFVAAAFLFLGSALVRQREQLLAYDWSVRPLALALSTVLLVAVLTGGVAIWSAVLRRLGHHVAFTSLLRIWFLSSLGRYIPGKVWQFVGVAELSRAAGLPALVGITSLVVYMGLAAVAAALVGIYLLPITGLGAWEPAMRWARLVAPAVLLLLHPRLFRGVLTAVGRLIRQPLGEWSAGWLDGIALVGACALMWLGFGAAFQLFVHSVAGTSATHLPALTAAFALSFLAGYAAVVAPAGLGAKDGALALLLAATLQVPLGVAAALSLATRVWSVAGDVLPALFFLRTARAPHTEPNTAPPR